MGVAFKGFDRLDKVPHWKAGTSWVQKVGYYKLHYSKVPRNKDWIWVIDHSIQLGPDKCLVILGIPKSKIPKDKALQKKDMTVLHLSVMQSSTGEIINDILEDLSRSLKIIPCQIVSDEGGDLVKGIRLFVANNPKCRQTNDIKHKMANWFKNNIGTSPNWDELLKKTASSRKKMQQTELVSLSAPSLKAKARYMNIDVITNWSRKILILLNHNGGDYDNGRVQEYLGWLQDYQSDIEVYLSITNMATLIDNHIKCGGLSRTTKSEVSNLLPSDSSLPVMGKKFKEDILNFIETQTCTMKSKDKFLGCTEILESLYSDLKRVSGQHTKSGFTKLILVLPAFVGELDDSLVRRAMNDVTNNDINEWAKLNIKNSVQSQRNRFSRWVKNISKNSDKFKGHDVKVA
jgi:hypothetical protein